jgi:hypothetical protein
MNSENVVAKCASTGWLSPSTIGSNSSVEDEITVYVCIFDARVKTTWALGLSF